MPIFNFEQMREDVARRAEAWRAQEIADLQRRRFKQAHDCRMRAAVLEQLAHDMEQQEQEALEAR